MTSAGNVSRLGNLGGRLYRGEVSVDFVGRQKTWYRIWGAIVRASVMARAFSPPQFSGDFKGGWVLKSPAPAATVTQVTNTVANAGGGSTLTVQKVGSNTWSVQTPVLKQ